MGKRGGRGGFKRGGRGGFKRGGKRDNRGDYDRQPAWKEHTAENPYFTQYYKVGGR